MLLPRVHIAPTASEALHHATSRITAGSVIVLAVIAPTSVVLHFEGGIYERSKDRPPTSEERINYAIRAGGRAAEHYPTVARMFVEEAQPQHFIQEGWVDTEAWTVDWFFTPRPLLTFPTPLPPRRRA